MAQRAVLLDHEGRERERFDAPFDCNGYEYEVREVENAFWPGESKALYKHGTIPLW
jgi:hypothetical protein